jgi:chaperone required for assembly of F1-ATPase
MQVCYYAEPALRGLRKRQEKAFKGVHGWLLEDWGVKLETTDGVTKINHGPAAMARVMAMVKVQKT